MSLHVDVTCSQDSWSVQSGAHQATYLAPSLLCAGGEATALFKSGLRPSLHITTCLKFLSLGYKSKAPPHLFARSNNNISHHPIAIVIPTRPPQLSYDIYLQKNKGLFTLAANVRAVKSWKKVNRGPLTNQNDVRWPMTSHRNCNVLFLGKR